ncbi:MAG: hypothetical protein FH748_02440 [Balneolaceae bacterium]|nr:hypothetical protein [Balneolaceae bacterium]
MKRTLFPYMLILLIAVLWIGCSHSEHTLAGSELDNASEAIMMEVNEATRYVFKKTDSTWTGHKMLYSLNSENEKQLLVTYKVVKDSSWKYFDLFVNHLDLYSLPAQHEIEGWVPDSGTMPKRVYSFTVHLEDTSRSYSYQDPIKEVTKHWQSTHVFSFVTLVQDELSWKEVKGK